MSERRQAEQPAAQNESRHHHQLGTGGRRRVGDRLGHRGRPLPARRDPQAFPEGSPTHPAYGAGHATVAGACVTILKAWFEESTKIETLFAPVTANPAGDGLDPYPGADKAAMTVGGELDKAGANVAIGRNMGGVHWRSDYTESVKLGERLAIQLLQEQADMYRESFSFTIRRFDGTSVVIS